MPTLNLGVIDVPYAERPSGRRRRRKGGGGKTTGDVAEILEARYHVMEHFWEIFQRDNVQDIEESLQAAIENLFAGGPVNITGFEGSLSKMEDRFKQMLSLRVLDTLGFPGIPTEAALRGVNHRLKRPYKRRAARPSFIDTGLYQSSFKTWVT